MTGVPRSCWVLVATALLTGSHAHAYSDPSQFGTPAVMGGGGDRWFTGSPADGFGCRTCHTHPRPISGLRVESLPSQYVPGATYEVKLTWPQTLSLSTDLEAHVVALVEFTDEAGNPAGSVAVPAGTALTELDSCKPYTFKVPAMNIFDAPNGRKIVGLEDCGGRQLRFQWTAPAQAAGPLFFSGGAVVSDAQNDIHNDGVVEFFRPILPQGQTSYDTEVQGGCAVMAGAPAGSTRLLQFLSVASAGIVILSRRRRRRP